MSARDTLFAELPGLICGRVSAEIPDLRECVPHGGRFDLDQIKRFAAMAPSVRVALLGAGPAQDLGGPQWRHPAFVLASGLGRDAAAAAICQRILAIVSGSRWDDPDLGPASGARADNLYSEGARSQGIALWAVSWEQPVQLSRSRTSDQLRLTSVHASFDPNAAAADFDEIPVPD